MRWEAVLVQPVRDAADDNVDVVVHFEDGRRFGATFFTLRCIQTLMDRWATTGECASGLYFWSRTPIVVRSLEQSVVEAVVADLLASGDFEGAFERLVP